MLPETGLRCSIGFVYLGWTRCLSGVSACAGPKRTNSDENQGIRRLSAIKGKSTKTIRAVVPGAIGLLLSMSAAAQGLIASGQPASVNDPSMEPTMMRVAPYPDEMYAPPGAAAGVPYASCYRIGRCSAYDLYRFRDRPNRLTRLAPEAPPEIVIRPLSIEYVWALVPVTPEENILPKYRTASQVRDEYRAVGRPVDGPNGRH